VLRIATCSAENGFECVPQAAVSAFTCTDLDAGERQVDGVQIQTL
jgi:hypothetical protein